MIEALKVNVGWIVGQIRSGRILESGPEVDLEKTFDWLARQAENDRLRREKQVRKSDYKRPLR